jgi:hypothetical protein
VRPHHQRECVHLIGDNRLKSTQRGRGSSPAPDFYITEDGMIIKEMYEKVTMENPCGQAVFMSRLDTTVRSLIARYGKKYVVFRHQIYQRPVSVEDEIPVYEEYFPAILDNILFLTSGNSDRKTDYVQEAEDAYKSVSKALLRGVKFRDADYPYFAG